MAFRQSLSCFFQDGGLNGWLAVLSLCIIRMTWVVLTKGLGMMLPTLQEQFGTSTWSVGWMVAIVDSSIGFAGIFASPLRERFGVRAVVTVSGLVIGASIIVASFVPSLYVITVILTLFTGPAIGIACVTNKELVGCWFTTSLTTAYAISTLGSASSFVTFVPLIQIFLDVYGWRGTMLLLGAILSHVAVCGALLKPPPDRESNDDYQTVKMDEDQGTSDDEVVPNSCYRCSCVSAVSSFISDTFRLGIFSSISFWLSAFIFSVGQVVYAAWLIYFVQYSTVSKGFSLEDASHFVVVYGIGRIVGCIIIGPLVQKVKVIGTYTWLGMSLTTLSLYYLVDPWLTSFWAISANVFIFGNVVSNVVTLIDVINKDVFGAEKLGFVFGWSGLMSGTMNLLLLYFPGLIYDITGSYTVAFSLIGGMQALTVVALLGLAWIQKRHQE